MVTFAAVDSVTPVTQGITVIVAGGVFALLTLLFTNRSKRQSEERIREAHEVDEKLRREEKASDREAAIAKEKRDYDRQDEVAKRVEMATALVSAKLTAVENISIVTHALVNSDKTASMREKLDDKISRIALMRELASFKESMGHPVTLETQQAIVTLEADIKTLRHDIDDRLAQQHAAEAANVRALPPPPPMTVDTPQTFTAEVTLVKPEGQPEGPP